MTQEEKQHLLHTAQTHVSSTCAILTHALKDVIASIKTRKEAFKTMGNVDKLIFTRLLAFDQSREVELEHLKESPYFIKCRVHLDGSLQEEDWYFGKFGYKESSIFSWVTPAASIRFESPGAFSYVSQNKNVIRGTLLARDQYMIVHGKILFLAVESTTQERELVYQEHFSTHKTGFVLPEIVAQMEKAQDQVIRASHKGAFVISGPAGSGKTTLALHRIAYLVQSPESTEQFPTNTIIVFVQDNGTKDYFSHLLPELGITHVKITTFAQWALEILELENVMFVDQYKGNEEEQDAYEQAKLNALTQQNEVAIRSTKNPFASLEECYAPFFTAQQKTQFTQQSLDRKLDRFDLTLLLQFFRETFGELSITKEYFLELKNGTLKKKVGRLPASYSLILVDEFQNYLPEQISLMKSCGNPATQSLIYVGDIAQQVQTGTIRDFKQVNETIPPERLVTLSKVYRNTKEILSFIAGLGYNVDIPDEIKAGVPVCEVHAPTKDAEIRYIETHLETLTQQQTLGVLARTDAYLDTFRTAFADNPRVHVMDIKEAQGVEFDVVCLVGITPTTFTAPPDRPEKQRILKNLLYIALTRAMSELHVLGEGKLEKVIKD